MGKVDAFRHNVLVALDCPEGIEFTLGNYRIAHCRLGCIPGVAKGKKGRKKSL